ncbi:MAG TPA: sugar transferase [Acidimicrobiales bacterium]|nr:sugar transferase [Acidimicrobiales bacterium]
MAFITVGPPIAVRTHPAASILKRSFDVMVAAVALAVLLPIGAVLATIIFVTSPGRITFRQRRIGLYGESFPIIKFRTMVRDAETRLQTDPELHAVYLANNHKVPAELDTRVTRLGRFLRSTSLDEIPQFWNVLVGHMSLVGPRPVVPGEIERYGRFTSVYESVRPGLTGLWQCSGRSEVSYDERVRMDVEYVENWTLWTDIVILLKTIPAVLRRHGAH